jgi:predicted kinase
MDTFSPVAAHVTCTLPASTLVCYKPIMRKWMRERMKRRKQGQDKPPSEAAPPPLQPAYFDAQAPPAAAPAEPSPSDVEDAPMMPANASGEAAQPGAGGEGRRRRRRRGRGGRGRGPARPAKAAAPAPLASTAETAPAGDVPSAPAENLSESAAAVPAPPAAGAKKPRGVVVLAIGLPGSGKSSWFKRHSIAPLSTDLLRGLLFDDPQEQRFQDLVFSNLRSMLKARLIARRPMNYVDATNLSPHERHGWVKLAKDYGYEVHGVFFDVPVEVCMERNQRRQRKVPEDVMRRMSAKLRPPTFEEGFSKITVVRVKKKEP